MAKLTPDSTMSCAGINFNIEENKQCKTLSKTRKSANGGGKVFDGEGKEIATQTENNVGAGKIKVVFTGRVRIRSTISFTEDNVVGYAESGSIFDVSKTIFFDGGAMYMIAEGKYISADPKLTERVK